jgi:hypothetical protein
MAHFIRGTGDARTPLQHSYNIFKEYLYFNKMTGLIGTKDSGRPVIVDTTLKGKAGDTVRYHFIPQNKSDGIWGQNATVLGNEDSLDEFYCDLQIDQLAKAFRKKGKMTTKRAIWDFRAESKNQLVNWWKEMNEILIFASLTGRIEGMVWKKGADDDLVYGEGRIARANGANAVEMLTAAQSDNTSLLGLMATSDKMNTYLLDELEIIAKKGNPKYRIRPYKTNNGKEVFRFDISLKAGRDLRQDARWEKHALSVIEAGVSEDPIANGALGVWNNIIVTTNERVEEFSNVAGTETYARNLLMGANAAVVGYAQTTDYTEELIDHKRIMSVNADEIRGQRKLTFDGVDVGVCQIITASN